MKTTKIAKKLLNVNSRSANRILKKRWEEVYHQMSDWHGEVNDLFNRWVDYHLEEAPSCYLPCGKVNPKWEAAMDAYQEDEGEFSKTEEAFILGFWGREVGLDPEWVTGEEGMIKWMLGIR